jgi:hypothetical protein
LKRVPIGMESRNFEDRIVAACELKLHRIKAACELKLLTKDIGAKGLWCHSRKTKEAESEMNIDA